MDIKPILSSLRRSPTGAILVALQIALALAIVVNSLFIIVQRFEKVNRDPGIDVPNIFFVGFQASSDKFQGEVTMREDWPPAQPARRAGGDGRQCRAALRRRLGTSMYTEPNEKGRRGDMNYFQVDEQGLETFGARLAEGRNFDATIVTKPARNSSTSPSGILITRDVAKDMFPDGSALGKTIYTGTNEPVTILGIIDHMHGSWPGWDKVGNVALFPVITDETYARYMVRAKPGQRDAMMKLAEESLGKVDNGRVILRVRSLEYIAASSYAEDRAMAVYLAVVIALLLGISALGIFGLAAFNVSTRTKQIGTRRAVGARRTDILQYFLAENWLITTVGVVLGCVLALVLGYWLSTTFELPRLKLYYLVFGVVGLWIVSLAAAFRPARRASMVSPAIATRTV